MLTELFNNPIAFLFWAVSLVIAITIHEFAHAYAAERLGDPTPRLMGRLTLNPLAHLDPLGTLMILVARFGWGKPVQFDPFNLRNPRRDSAIISIAGPLSNMLVAIIASLCIHFLLSIQIGFVGIPAIRLPISLLFLLLEQLMVMNVILAVFNLIPIHPLDGFKIVGGILPEEYAREWNQLEAYGMIFLLFLVFPIFGGASPINQLISPIIDTVLSLLLPFRQIL